MWKNLTEVKIDLGKNFCTCVHREMYRDIIATLLVRVEIWECSKYPWTNYWWIYNGLLIQRNNTSGKIKEQERYIFIYMNAEFQVSFEV